MFNCAYRVGEGDCLLESDKERLRASSQWPPGRHSRGLVDGLSTQSVSDWHKTSQADLAFRGTRESLQIIGGSNTPH